MHFNIPGHEEPMEIHTLILDLNGTLTIDGKVIAGVQERLNALREQLRLVLFTGDTQGNAGKIAQELGLEVRVKTGAEAKAAEARLLQQDHCATIGNGRIDLELFRAVRLRICVHQAEGVHPLTLLDSDIVIPSINDALDLFLHPRRLIATLRK